MVILGGGVGIVGNIVAGRLGDRIGRRRVGALFLALIPLWAALYYNGPSRALPVGFAGFVFCATAAGVIVRAFSTELFPTSHRGRRRAGRSSSRCSAGRSASGSSASAPRRSTTWPYTRAGSPARRSAPRRLL
jgi:predicted MFS family arabinose efflux permease